MSLRGAASTASAGALIAVTALGLAACGSSSKKSSTQSTGGASGQPLALSISESGKAAKFSGPASITGGLVRMSVTNGGKSLHAAQLVRVDAPHTIGQALQIVAGNSPKTPSWIHGEGGLGPVAPGRNATAVLNLPAGNYAVTDVGGPGGPGAGPPAEMALTVRAGSPGTLPSTPTTITATAPAKDKYHWQISGPLSSGTSNVTFVSKGNNTLHLLGAARITGNHSTAEIIKALDSNGPPPSWVDRQATYTSAVIDGNKSQVTPLPLPKPGRYVLFCPLTDRDGGKNHFKEGLLTTVTVK